MSSRGTARATAALCVIALLGFGVFRIDQGRHNMGKQAFLDEQGAQFDKMYATVSPLGHFLLVGAVVGGLILGTYEVLAIALYATLKRRGRFAVPVTPIDTVAEAKKAVKPSTERGPIDPS